jgi:hypothetical protein
LKTESNEEKYKAQYPDACEELTAWELSGTLREFPPMKYKRLWFDYPIHRVDEYNFLASANYADPGNGGVGKDQNEKEDWFDIAEDIIALKDRDTCATVDEIRISKKNAQRVFNAKKTNWMTATLQDGTTVVSRISDHVIYKGKEFKKGGSNNSRWMCDISNL